MKQAFSYLAARLAEPSTHNAIALFVAGIGLKLDPGIIQYADLAVAGLFGLAGFLLPEGGQKG